MFYVNFICRKLENLHNSTVKVLNLTFTSIMIGKLSTQMTKVVVNLKLIHFQLDFKGTFPFHAKYMHVATMIYLPPESRYRRDPQQQHLCYSCAEAGHSSGLTVRGTFVHCLPTPSPHFC